MWIPKAITENDKTENAFTANVAHGSAGNVRLAEGQIGGELFLPYGLESVPPKGARAAAVQAGRTVCVLGTRSEEKLSLEPGEIGLYSKGGASIVLKNDGRVLINGRSIE